MCQGQSCVCEESFPQHDTMCSRTAKLEEILLRYNNATNYDEQVARCIIFIIEKERKPASVKRRHDNDGGSSAKRHDDGGGRN